jgi:hypothetical protein
LQGDTTASENPSLDEEQWPVATGDIVLWALRRFWDDFKGLVAIIPEMDLPPKPSLDGASLRRSLLFYFPCPL